MLGAQLVDIGPTSFSSIQYIVSHHHRNQPSRTIEVQARLTKLYPASSPPAKSHVVSPKLSFNFEWPEFSADFYTDAREMLAQVKHSAMWTKREEKVDSCCCVVVF